MDFYRARLKAAQYGWMEFKCDGRKNFVGRPRRKDRINGRAAKRAARADALREMLDEAAAFDPNEERALAALLDCEAGLCAHDAIEVSISSRGSAHAAPAFDEEAC